MSYSIFDDCSYEQLQLYIEKGKSGDMPENLVEYLSVIELIRSTYDKYRTKSFIIKMLGKPPYGLSEYDANKLYADALNFFYADNAVKREAWANIYADRFDKLALLCIEADDHEAASRNWEKASKLRMGEEKKQVIPRELLSRRPIFYTISPKDVGLPDANRRKLAQFIDSLPDIPGDERMRLHRDALTDQAEGNVFDTEIEDIDFADVK
jgi:hypothetical protein